MKHRTLIAMTGVVALAPMTAITGGGLAHASSAPSYTITKVSRAGFFGGTPAVDSCRFKQDNPLLLDVTATASGAAPSGQVHVKGMQVAVFRGTTRLGTLPVMEGYLEPGGDQGSNFLEVSCRDWRTLMPGGFGGPSSAYLVQLAGTGRAYDSNDGSPAGAVYAVPTGFSVSVKQFATFSAPKGRKVGQKVALSTRFTTWRKVSGRFGWAPLKRARVVLVSSPDGGPFRKVDSAETNTRGRVVLACRPGRQGTVVRYKLAGHTYPATAAYVVDARGGVTFAAR